VGKAWRCGLPRGLQEYCFYQGAVRWQLFPFSAGKMPLAKPVLNFLLLGVRCFLTLGGLSALRSRRAKKFCCKQPSTAGYSCQRMGENQLWKVNNCLRIQLLRCRTSAVCGRCDMPLSVFIPGYWPAI